MPHSTRLSTPITRSYLSDQWLNAIDDALAREFFFRAKLACDNLGRLPGDPGMLAGILFPGVPLNRNRVQKVLDVLFKGRLIFYYQVGRQWFVEICDTGLTQTLVGNMSDKSEYPAPPQTMVQKWETFTGRKHRKIERVRPAPVAPKDGNIPSKDDVQTGSDDVRTRSNESEPVQTCMPGLVRVGQGLGREGLGEAGSDFAEPANATLPSTVADANQPTGITKTYGEFLTDPTSGESLHVLSAGKFLDHVGFKGYKQRDEFLAVIRSCFDACRDIPLGGKPQAAEFMGYVVNTCQLQGFKAPKGWMRVLDELRAEAKV